MTSHFPVLLNWEFPAPMTPRSKTVATPRLTTRSTLPSRGQGSGQRLARATRNSAPPTPHSAARRPSAVKSIGPGRLVRHSCSPPVIQDDAFGTTGPTARSSDQLLQVEVASVRPCFWVGLRGGEALEVVDSLPRHEVLIEPLEDVGKRLIHRRLQHLGVQAVIHVEVAFELDLYLLRPELL